MRGAAGAVAFAALVTGAHAAESCAAPDGFEPRGWVEMDDIVLLYRTQPQAIQVSQHFSLDVIVCGSGKMDLRVDAVMPNHRHGMNYRPRVVEEAPGRYRAEGMLFHMPGKWRFFFDVRAGERTRRLWQDLEVE